jgi:hypothetical protein
MKLNWIWFSTCPALFATVHCSPLSAPLPRPRHMGIKLEPYRNMSEEIRFINKPRFCCVGCSAVIVSPKQPSLCPWSSNNKGAARRDGQQVVQWKGRKGFVSSSLLMFHKLSYVQSPAFCAQCPHRYPGRPPAAHRHPYRSSSLLYGHTDTQPSAPR